MQHRREGVQSARFLRIVRLVHIVCKTPTDVMLCVEPEEQLHQLRHKPSKCHVHADRVRHQFVPYRVDPFRMLFSANKVRTFVIFTNDQRAVKPVLLRHSDAFRADSAVRPLGQHNQLVRVICLIRREAFELCGPVREQSALLRFRCEKCLLMRADLRPIDHAV